MTNGKKKNRSDYGQLQLWSRARYLIFFSPQIAHRTASDTDRIALHTVSLYTKHIFSFIVVPAEIFLSTHYLSLFKLYTQSSHIFPLAQKRIIITLLRCCRYYISPDRSARVSPCTRTRYDKRYPSDTRETCKWKTKKKKKN